MALLPTSAFAQTFPSLSLLFRKGSVKTKRSLVLKKVCCTIPYGNQV
ncbi:hypothetical protein PC120_g9602 [Phytophthora cactorum]|nr:hypothetical protein PC120_g9602 [Phytophthora cactorum]